MPDAARLSTPDSAPPSQGAEDTDLGDAVDQLEEEQTAETDANGGEVCGYYLDSQLEVARAFNSEIIDAAAASTVGGVALPTADCAMKMTLGNGIVQVNLGYENADAAAMHQQFLAAGFADVQVWEDPEGTGSSYIMGDELGMSGAAGGVNVTIWAGDRVVSGIAPEGVYIGYFIN